MDGGTEGRDGLARSCSVLAGPCEICRDNPAWLYSCLENTTSADFYCSCCLYAAETGDLQCTRRLKEGKLWMLWH